MTKDRRIHQTVRTVICKECGLVFLNPGPTEEGYLGYYQKTLGVRATPPLRENIIRKKSVLASFQIRFIKDCLGDISSMDTVDVGSGWGGFLYYLKPEVGTLVATEVLEPVKMYIEKEFQCPLSLVTRLSDGFPPASFDLITATAVIEHYTNPLPVVLDYAQALRPGGSLFLFTPDVKGMCFSLGIDQYFKFLHPYNYSVNSLRSLLSKAGFTDFHYWSSQPDYSLRSLRNPAHIVAGNILMVAKKGKTPGQDEDLYKDDPAEIVEIFKRHQIIEDEYQKRRLIWLSPWAKPLRAAARLLPKSSRDQYLSMVEQYETRYKSIVGVL
ncbi:MAG: methyltransferase domain-containing protein [Deltaproteobacteria bacterium]|nr:methyltransferase domain-containing protein [Deltaproteobacteria bacterium]